MVNYGEAIKRPFTDTTALVIGFLISFIPLVNVFLLTGYGIRSAENAVKGKMEMPSWLDNFGDLIVKCIIGMVIAIIYAIIPVAITVFAAASFAPTLAAALMTGNVSMATITGFFSGLAAWSVVLALVWLVYGLLLLMGLVFYAKEGKIESAFKLGDIFRKAFSGPGIVSYIVLILYMLIATTVIGFIAVMPGVGFAVAAVLSAAFYYAFTIAAFTMFSHVHVEVK